MENFKRCGLGNNACNCNSEEECGYSQPDIEDDSCERCGEGTDWEDCYQCGGEGLHDDYEDDPLWYEPGDTSTCDICEGKGGWIKCLNSKCK
jgi:hypothetical protein